MSAFVCFLICMFKYSENTRQIFRIVSNIIDIVNISKCNKNNCSRNDNIFAMFYTAGSREGENLWEGHD